MRSSSGSVLAWALVALFTGACKLQPPPAIPKSEAKSASSDEPGADVPIPAQQPPAGEDTSNLDALMAAPSCNIQVVSVLKSGRAFWSGVGKFTCTYELLINGSSYKYTRLLPRDRKLEPAEACERGISSMESVVRSATRDCREMQVTDRSGQGLTPLR